MLLEYLLNAYNPKLALERKSGACRAFSEDFATLLTLYLWADNTGKGGISHIFAIFIMIIQ